MPSHDFNFNLPGILNIIGWWPLYILTILQSVFGGKKIFNTLSHLSCYTRITDHVLLTPLVQKMGAVTIVEVPYCVPD